MVGTPTGHNVPSNSAGCRTRSSAGVMDLHTSKSVRHQSNVLAQRVVAVLHPSQLRRYHRQPTRPASEERSLRKRELPQSSIPRVDEQLIPAAVRERALLESSRDEKEDAPIHLVRRLPILPIDPSTNELTLLGTQIIERRAHATKRQGVGRLDGGTIPLIRRYVIRLP